MVLPSQETCTRVTTKYGDDPPPFCSVLHLSRHHLTYNRWAVTNSDRESWRNWRGFSRAGWELPASVWGARQHLSYGPPAARPAPDSPTLAPLAVHKELLSPAVRLRVGGDGLETRVSSVPRKLQWHVLITVNHSPGFSPPPPLSWSQLQARLWMFRSFMMDWTISTICGKLLIV